MGRVLSLSPVRDTMDRQQAECRFVANEICAFENQNVDFVLEKSEGNLLQKLLGGSGM